ncbi:hypothetical protein ACOP1M_00130 [Staphylococcus warneri]|uniref:hypothetical protein n=1 Tax=Staphylococcus warneri TaxID=1292 RepID=UPI003CEF6D1D
MEPLNDAEKVILYKNGLTQNQYKNRIKMGWDSDNALFLDNSFRMVNGEIFKTFIVDNKSYYMTPAHYFKMRSKQLNYEVVKQRLSQGMSMSESVKHAYGELLCDNYSQEEVEHMKKHKNHRKESIQYANLLFGQMMKNFISEEEYQKCVKLN